MRAAAHCADPPDALPRDLGRAFPRLAAYLGGLPHGLASYPGCQMRGTPVARYVDDPSVRAAAAGAPGVVLSILTPPHAMWVPEVRCAAAILAVGDALRLSDRALADRMVEHNRALFRNVVYRALMAFLSPAALLARAPSRWDAFHRGTALEVVELADRTALGRLTFPPGLISGALVPSYGAALQAALEHCRAEGATLAAETVTPTSVTYRARWS
ncbi:MAG TPA: DUF2378 family protein [Anaeromyxobacteraceae bacterium]|nr:DUF2378 family protein [Anaeromyxobacteraceae bacterium]